MVNLKAADEAAFKFELGKISTELPFMSKGIKRQSEFVKWMGPLIDCLRSLGGSAKPREVSDWIAETLNLSDEQREETLKSGQERS